jgi:uncharacterized protein (DUF433 family)
LKPVFRGAEIQVSCGPYSLKAVDETLILAADMVDYGNVKSSEDARAHIRRSGGRIDMKKLRYISSNQNIMGGKPCFRGTRIAVCTVLNFLAAGDSIESILKDYPQLTRTHIKEALSAAAGLFDYKGMDISA